VAETNNTLHDSLDLTELRQEIAVAQNLQKTLKKRSRYHYWALAGVAGLLVFAIISLEFSPTLTRRTTAISKVALVGFTYIFYLPRILVAYREHKKFARRLANYAPEYVPHTSLRNTISVIVNHSFFVIAFSLAVFIDDTWLIILGLPILLLILGKRLFWFAYQKLLQWTYAGGLSRTEQVLRFLPGNFYLRMNQGIILMNVGRLDEAAQIFRELLGRKNRRNIYLIPLLLNNLGCCFTFMKHYAEGLTVLEASIRISPTINQTYDTLADWYLEQKLDPERALELTEFALELNNPKDIASTAIKQATSGRALASTGRDTRAEAMLEQALSVIPQLPATVNAEINRQVGYARLAQGNQAAAVEHFQKAIALDPDGLYGKMAQEALETINLQPAS
jgi:tetratricopeptide (TPR) repeat protein